MTERCNIRVTGYVEAWIRLDYRYLAISSALSSYRLGAATKASLLPILRFDKQFLIYIYCTPYLHSSSGSKFSACFEAGAVTLVFDIAIIDAINFMASGITRLGCVHLRRKKCKEKKINYSNVSWSRYYKN